MTSGCTPDALSLANEVSGVGAARGPATLEAGTVMAPSVANLSLITDMFVSDPVTFRNVCATMGRMNTTTATATTPPVAGPARSGLSVLALSLGATVVACGPDPLRVRRSHLIGTGPLLVLCPDRSLVSHQDRRLIQEAAELGRRVVIAVGDRGRGDLALAFPSPEDPLVLSSQVRATGIGRLDGLVLEADDLVPLDPTICGDLVAVMAIVDGHGGSSDTDRRTLAATVRCGSGTVDLIGSVAVTEDRWITAGDNAAILAELLTGTNGAPSHQRHMAEALVAQHRPASPRPHRELPVVADGDDDWAAMVDAAHDADAADLDPQGPAFVRAAGHARRLLPIAVHDALIDLGDDADTLGAVLMTGVPLGLLPATPTSPTEPTDKDHTSEFVLLAIARALGQPIGYLPEHGGTIVQNLLPIPEAAHLQTSTSSAVELEFHTETAFHPHRPRYLLLLCLRGDDTARTLLCSVGEIVDQLPLAVRRVLSEPRFRTGVDRSFADRSLDGGSCVQQRAGSSGHGPLGRVVPVLSGDPGRPTLTFDADLMHATDDEADAALETFRRLARDRRIGVTLRQGDALVIDNHRCIHGRSAFAARFDGTDRWLQRSFVVSDLSASAGARIGRVITTRFV